MAYGRLAPFSRYPAGGGATTYPKFYNTGSGVGNWRMLGIGVAASITSDAWWELFWAVPTALPTGTPKLELWSRANATTGAAKINPYWTGVNMGASPHNITHNPEGTTTITWTTAHVVMQTKITLDASAALTAGQILSMALRFEGVGWTLAQESVWIPWLIWE